jgi:hypothetical protein
VASGKVSAPSAVLLKASNSRFGVLSGSLSVGYWARTSDGGGGSITIQASSDFSPSGGPLVSGLIVTCSGATLGTGCAGQQSLATSAQSTVLSLPGGACTGGGGLCSNQDPNTVLLMFALPNEPRYKTGDYSAQINLTISTM